MPPASSNCPGCERKGEPNLKQRIVAGSQIRAARALLARRRKDLSSATNLHPNAVAYWERRDVIPVDASEPHARRRTSSTRSTLQRSPTRTATASPRASSSPYGWRTEAGGITPSCFGSGVSNQAVTPKSATPMNRQNQARVVDQSPGRMSPR
jgi:hypothetical protein